MPNDLWGPQDKAHWAPFRNDAGEIVPPFACLRITGTVKINGRLIFKAAKPDGSEQKWYAFNSGAQVAVGGYGECTFTPQSIARYDSQPSAGTEMSAQSGSWNLANAPSGFVSFGVHDNDRGLSLTEVIQVASPTSTSVNTATYAFAAETGQTFTSPTTEAVMTWNTSGAYGNSTANATTYRFKAGVAGVWLHKVKFDGRPASGGSGGWAILSSCTVLSMHTAGSYSAAVVDFDGTTGDKPLRNVACFTGWVMAVNQEVWGALSVRGEDLTIGSVNQEFVYLGTS